jgi:protein-S-isoprenylcysteine O-methyltransferase Ste14
VSTLDLKVPPDIVALLVAALMWLVSLGTPSLTLPAALRVLAAGVFFVGGAVLIVAARVELARARTTFSPVAPERARRVVTTGVYRFSRNPMYLGTLLSLVAFGVLLANPLAVLVSALFAGYINRFQIVPEERILQRRFGSTYDQYLSAVRRWI